MKFAFDLAAVAAALGKARTIVRAVPPDLVLAALVIAAVGITFALERSPLERSALVLVAALSIAAGSRVRQLLDGQ